jgi:hypothetical protein
MQATIIDRIAIIVGTHLIKDSDIERDIRVVDFLNRQKLSFDLPERRVAASRLIDQAIIQRELLVGEYQTPPESDAEKLLLQTQRDRARSAALFDRELSTYGLDRAQLQRYLLWQLTVLRFIDQRFRPAVLVTDADVEKYYSEHSAEFKSASAAQAPSLEDIRSQVREKLTDEGINTQFDNWLAARRKSLKVEYREESLK